MTAAMVPAMAAQDISAFLTVVQNTILGSANKQDLPGLDDSTSSRFQQPNLKAWIDPKTKGVRLFPFSSKKLRIPESNELCFPSLKNRTNDQT